MHIQNEKIFVGGLTLLGKSLVLLGHSVLTIASSLVPNTKADADTDTEDAIPVVDYETIRDAVSKLMPKLVGTEATDLP